MRPARRRSCAWGCDGSRRTTTRRRSGPRTTRSSARRWVVRASSERVLVALRENAGSVMQKAQRTNAVASLFPPGVVAFEARGIVTPDVLLEAERECVARAVDKRIREFAAGRLCARSGLAELGFAP